MDPLGSNINICRPYSMPQEIVLVDGPSRSGKTVTSRLIASLDRVELERNEEILVTFKRWVKLFQ